MRISPKSHGFTMLEMAVVITIIGLLTGGILVGKDMIEGAQTQRILRDIDAYANAIEQFRIQYRYLPGDFNDAVKYWGDNANLCADATVTDGTFGACNGDGNGLVQQTASIREDLYAWLQLGSSGLIPGTFNYDSTLNETKYRGLTYPPTQRGGVMTLKYYGPAPNTYAAINTQIGHFLKVGIGNSAVTNAASAIVSAQEAASMDKRVDDGLSNSGNFMAANGSGTATCVASGAYMTTSADPGCVLYSAVDRK